MNASNQIDNIDAYLRGELTPNEVSIFESQLKKDDSLAEELVFQRQVVSGIQHVRKLQLKNRLSQIDVAAGSVAGQITWLKVAGGMAIITLIGLSLWQLFSVETSGEIAGEIDAPILQVETISVIEIPEQSMVENAAVESENIEVNVPEPIPSDESLTITPVEEVTSASEESRAFAPQVDLPDDDRELDSSEFEPEELEETFTNNDLGSNEIDALNIERFDQKAKSLRYRYYDGKLALYGDFGSSPYQILEINQQDGGKQIFLLHSDQFYRLESSKEEKGLVAIKDPALLRELHVFHNKK